MTQSGRNAARRQAAWLPGPAGVRLGDHSADDGPDLIFGNEDDDEIWDGEGGDDLHGNGGNQDVWKRCNDLTFDAADGIEVMLGPDLDYC